MKKSTPVLSASAAAKSANRSHRLHVPPDGQSLEPSSRATELLSVLSAVKNGDLTVRMPFGDTGLSGTINETLNQVIVDLGEARLRNQNRDWLKSNLAKFAVMMQGQKDLKTVAQLILSELAKVVTSHYGAFYILQPDEKTPVGKLFLLATYAHAEAIQVPKEFAIGEGLVGQCVVEKERIVLSKIPPNYISIHSALGSVSPSHVVILPVLFESNVKAVIELASLELFSDIHLEFLGQLVESIGIVLNSIETFAKTERLLGQAQLQAEELTLQQEKLRLTYVKLEEKALLLEKQKEEVEAKNKELAFQNGEKERRAAELSVANEELAFQNLEKEKRAAELVIANKAVEESRKSLEEKAAQLTLTSKYKSEFLANMSHELRSPLNSLLILAQQLYENEEGTLSVKQVRFAKTIFSCGNDLIHLINDILDLSKIESGIISVNVSSVRIEDIAAFAEATFRPVSDSRQLKFSVEIDEGLPASIETDMLRLNQILKNLLSNAFKFTEKGVVTLRIANANRNWKSGHPVLGDTSKIISFAISDTGIGIANEKQKIIFEAFQQAEGATSRKFGGTGLGLSISSGLVDLLGGTIELKSELDRGSTFTVYLPWNGPAGAMIYEPDATTTRHLFTNHENPRQASAPPSVPRENPDEQVLVNPHDSSENKGDDRNNIKSNDKLVLVVEHDLRFGKIMVEKAHENGMKAIVATNYMEVFDFINRLSPVAITVDVNMPDTSGWKIMQLLRSELIYNHIPIHVISGEENRITALKRGARSFLLKPLENGLLNKLFADIISFEQKAVKRVLLVEDNEVDSSQILTMLEDERIQITVATTCAQALERIAGEDFDCIILDYIMPDCNGSDLIHEVNRAKKIFTPVIVYSAMEFSSMEMNNVNFHSNAHIVKEVNSIENLLTEAISQLHIDYRHLAPAKRRIIENIHNKNDILVGKSVLVVDDDVRNLFAMTALFERFNMNVFAVESGREAMNSLRINKSIEMVLMDIMMPDLDGYETTRQIRQEQKNNWLPIIAVTAKAMKKDRERCLEAGASDYITKPVKTDQLLSLMRLWFCKR
jgi:signal transduction histidine kinase/CheY-like chemotaxis protein